MSRASTSFTQLNVSVRICISNRLALAVFLSQTPHRGFVLFYNLQLSALQKPISSSLLRSKLRKYNYAYTSEVCLLKQWCALPLFVPIPSARGKLGLEIAAVLLAGGELLFNSIVWRTRHARPLV